MKLPCKQSRKKWTVCIALLMCAVILVAGCKKKPDPEPDSEPATDFVTEENKTQSEIPVETSPVDEKPETERTEESEPNHEGEIRSSLSGMWIPEEYAGLRPIAMMINNIDAAYPQAGLSDAGIIYEALAEGGITRLMGLFDFVSGDRYGSVRSARHYYVMFAEEYDAIFVHYGQTKYADSKMKELGTDHLNGLAGEGTTVFYRDPSIKAPHNAFASSEGINQAIENKKIRREQENVQTTHFTFSFDSEVIPSGEGVMNANKITLPFSKYGTSSLEYRPEEGLYHRFAYGEEHIDPVNGEALTFRSILVQFVQESNIDKNGYQTMELDQRNGKGYYITSGKAVPLYWSKGEPKTPTKYYFDEAMTQEIVFNPGRIYIGVFPVNRAEMIEFE